jgi:NAD(P)-dependent dehydrogenase (short-subunit alcohol dehydrogenase family)
MSGRLQDKIVIVTGAGSSGPGIGNGKAAAVTYAREGAIVLAVDRDEASLADTVAMIEGEGNRVQSAAADVTDSAAVKAFVDDCVARNGRVDVLHNNVGIVEVGGPVEIEEENWDRLMAVNVKSMYLTCKHILPVMERQGAGVIVNISSTASVRYVGYPSVSYCASKAAINQLTQNIAVQYGPKGIRANCVLPGLINTPLIRPLHEAYGSGGFDEMVRQRDALIPLGAMGTAWDVADASLFLASDQSRYVNGAQLVVDGGLTCKYS